MGYRLVLALVAGALLVWAWQRFATRRAPLSLPLALTLLLLPAGLLVAADVDAAYLFVHGCINAGAGGWKLLGLGSLAVANAALLGSALQALLQRLTLARAARALPLLPAERAEALQAALPDLAGVELRVVEAEQPVIFTLGMRRPLIVLSSWVLERLDALELRAALAHELGHVAHGDSLLLLLLQAACPGGLGFMRQAFEELRAALEQRADAWGAARVADRLALASALVKVSRYSLPPLGVPGFAERPASVQRRVSALLDGRAIAPAPSDWLPLLALAVDLLWIAFHLVGHLCSLHA